MSPLQTIFESARLQHDLSSQVMRQAGEGPQAIASFQQGRQEQQEGPAGPGLHEPPAPQEEQPEGGIGGRECRGAGPTLGTLESGLGWGKGGSSPSGPVGLTSGL